MGSVIPFPGRRMARARQSKTRRIRVEWRVYSPSRDRAVQAGGEADANNLTRCRNADARDMPDVFGAVADWRPERRTVGDWGPA